MSRARAARTDRNSRLRLAFLATGLLALFMVAALRAAQLQIYRAEELAELADRQRRRQLELIPERGAILDRNGRELAVSIPGTSVFVDPSQLLAAPADLERVCAALDLPLEETRKRLQNGGSRFAWLKRRIPPRQEAALGTLGIDALGVAREPHRYYPKKSLAGPLMGFVGRDGTGLGGLEYQFEAELRGVPRKVWAERDARGRLLLAQVPDPRAGQGSSLVLTIDETIQNIAEEELAAAVKKYAARGGTALVMHPASGEILALAQAPAFNPNALAGSSPEQRKLAAAVDVYEPGSTFKALFLGILMENKVARPADLVFCEQGEWRVHGHTIHDTHPHGWLSVAHVLEMSSNIGVAKLSEKVSPQVLYDGLRAFGLGQTSGLGIPGESRGILPAVAEWSKMTPKTVSYGQGVSATAVQVVSAFAAIANNGVRMQPRLVRAVVDEHGQPRHSFPPETAGRALSETTAATLTRLLEQVVYGDEGTAAEAAVPGFRVAGKTGTSWKPDTKRGGYLRNKVVASFAGFVPSRRPELAILVAVDEPGKGPRYGGVIAAPAFREIARHSLAYLKVAPGEEASEPVTSRDQDPAPARPRRSSTQAAAGTMPDLNGLTMRETLRALQATGLQLTPNLLGSGVAGSQDPAPGDPISAAQTCSVVFRPLL